MKRHINTFLFWVREKITHDRRDGNCTVAPEWLQYIYYTLNPDRKAREYPSASVKAELDTIHDASLQMAKAGLTGAEAGERLRLAMDTVPEERCLTCVALPSKESSCIACIADGYSHYRYRNPNTMPDA